MGGGGRSVKQRVPRVRLGYGLSNSEVDEATRKNHDKVMEQLQYQLFTTKKLGDIRKKIKGEEIDVNVAYKKEKLMQDLLHWFAYGEDTKGVKFELKKIPRWQRKAL